MKRLLLALAVLSQAAFLTAAAQADETDSIGYFDAIAQEPQPVVGETYYLRHCIMAEKGEHIATNYWRGALYPINTKVTLTAMKKKHLELKNAETGETIKVVNVPDYTKKDIPTIARNMLTRTPVPVDKFDEEVARKIKNGTPALGMTKEQVVMARGYPPAHRTASLDQDTWVYWPSRLVMQTLVFEDGKLVEGRGLE